MIAYVRACVLVVLWKGLGVHWYDFCVMILTLICANPFLLSLLSPLIFLHFHFLKRRSHYLRFPTLSAPIFRDLKFRKKKTFWFRKHFFYYYYILKCSMKIFLIQRLCLLSSHKHSSKPPTNRWVSYTPTNPLGQTKIGKPTTSSRQKIRCSSEGREAYS